jgi:small-conductance mechanosensitive channel
MQALLEMMDSQFLGSSAQDYLVSAAVFLGVLVGLPIAKAIILRHLKAISQRTTNDFDDLLHELLRRIVGQLVYLSAALYCAALFLTLPDNLSRLLQGLLVIVLTVKIAQVLQGLTAYGVRKWAEHVTKDDPTGAAMVKNMDWLARLVLWTATLLFILDNLGINVTAFVASVGIGGIAIALAAQSVLGDVFSGFAILVDKPFRVGDFIIVGDLLGTVEHVGFKTTRILSLFGEQLIFSNSDLTSSRIRNYGRMRERRVQFSVGVIYQTSVENVKAIPPMIKRIIEEHQRVRFDRAHFKSFGDFALIYEFVFWVLTPDYNVFMDLQQSINFRIVEEFRRAGIEFAYPTQQLYMTTTEPA